MKILDGKKVAKEIEHTLSKRIASFSRAPKLAIVMVGERADSKAYVGQKIKMAERIGAKADLFSFAANVPEGKIVEKIKDLNQDSDIDGIILQLPLPEKFSSRKIIDCIAPLKDVDGLTSLNQGKFLTGEKAFSPATARGVISLLAAYKIPLLGKRAVVLGRSLLVGRPVALLLDKAGATVTQCHSKTKHISDITKEADVLISAIGKSAFVKASFVSKKQVVVDVGISIIEKKGVRKLVGDVDFERVAPVVKAISPVPGGVGPMTVVSLFENLCDAYEQALR